MELGKDAQSGAKGWNDAVLRRAVKPEAKSNGEEVSDEEREEGEGKLVMAGREISIVDSKEVDKLSF